MGYLSILLAVAGMFVCGSVASSIGEKRGAGTMGFWLGFCLGPIGILAAAALDERRQCPLCGTRVEHFARVCPSCHDPLPPPPKRRRILSPRQRRKAEQAEIEHWLEAPGPIDLSLKKPGEN